MALFPRCSALISLRADRADASVEKLESGCFAWEAAPGSSSGGTMAVGFTWRIPSPRKESGVLLDHQTIENVFMAEAGWRGDVTGVELFQEAAHGSSGGLFADVREIRRGRTGPIHSQSELQGLNLGFQD